MVLVSVLALALVSVLALVPVSVPVLVSISETLSVWYLIESISSRASAVWDSVAFRFFACHSVAQSPLAALVLTAVALNTATGRKAQLQQRGCTQG